MKTIKKQIGNKIKKDHLFHTKARKLKLVLLRLAVRQGRTLVDISTL